MRNTQWITPEIELLEKERNDALAHHCAHSE